VVNDLKGKYTGKDGAMGLKVGQYYEVTAVYRVSNEGYPLTITIESPYMKTVECPYSSIESLLRNWKFKTP